MAPTTIHKEERPVKDLFSDFLQEVSTMFRDEIALAKNEMSVKIRQELKDVTLLAVGGFIIYAGLFFLLGAAVAGLSSVLPVWLSSLVIGIAVTLTGYLMIQKGKKDIKERDLRPTDTIESVKESKEWIRQKM